jgi:hypothetical protein
VKKKTLIKGLLRVTLVPLNPTVAFSAKMREVHMAYVFFRIPKDYNLWVEKPRAKPLTVAG